MLLSLLLALGLLLSTMAGAQDDTVASVRALELEVAALRRDVDKTTAPDARAALAGRAAATHDKATALQHKLVAPIARIEERIEQLGADAGTSTDAAVRQQHQGLSKEREAQLALSRRTALAEVESQQIVNALGEERTRALGEALFLRTASPLTPALWIDGVASLRADLGRAYADAPPARSPARPLPLVLLALALWGVACWALLRPGQRLLDRVGARLADRFAGREVHFSRSLFAVWSVVVGVVLPMTAASLLLIVLHWAAFAPLVLDVAAVAITAVVFGFFVHAIVYAILQPRDRTRRLSKISDEAAMLGVRGGNALASAIVLIVAVEAMIDRLDVGSDSQTFLHSALALVTVVQIAWALAMLGRMHHAGTVAETPEAQATRGRMALWVGIGWLAVLLLALSGALGYVSFANRISQWAIWAAIVLLTTHIAMHLVDGLCKLLATATSHNRQDVPNRALQQATVLLSAVCRLLLLLLACGALLVPFGAGFTSVLSLLTPLAQGFQVGGVTISAVALLRALTAFGIVIVLIRFVRGWITVSYLPTTGLQADARDSIDKILRYVGIVLAVLWALTAFGVGMEKVAILASALSVGIGFGLQAITQNFVSGLILLVERPVKIGDWVKLNDVEGDIRRINVRSTEIRVGDHSTMIVPNSELITKVVQNKTKDNSIGRAQMFLSVPVEADLDAAIDAIMTTLRAEDDVLDTPAPAVFVDRVEGGMAVLNCFMHVRSPRMAYGVRSRMILAALRTLRERGVPVSLPPQQFVIAAPPLDT